jgi:NADPH:quinone reductase-like Zn-dependent oxidoreductase
VAVGVNPIDYKTRHGWLHQVFPVTFPAVPGSEAAGIVDEVGEGVTGISVGDEVLGFPVTGAYAEYALAVDVASKPAGTDPRTRLGLAPGAGQQEGPAVGAAGAGPLAPARGEPAGRRRRADRRRRARPDL